MKEKHIFGTDGIRGIAGEFPLTKEIIYLTTKHLTEYMEIGKIIVADDSRKSSEWIKSVLFKGLKDSGIKGIDIGTITTPALAKIVSLSDEYDGGIMISASHNPYDFNGIKFLNKEGMKLSDDIEHMIENKVLDELPTFSLNGEELKIPKNFELQKKYTNYIFSKFKKSNNGGKKLIVDCANGASSTIAGTLFSSLGYNTETINCSPTGLNINLNCGSLHPENLATEVKKRKASAGIAFDGDGDRVIMIDEKGNILDGDILLYILLKYYHKQGYNRPIVGTIMSNLALEKKAESLGLKFIRTPVGDKYVWENMVKSDSLIGGETSGHIILREYHTTGDGILVALKILEIMESSATTLSKLAEEIKLYPQI